MIIDKMEPLNEIIIIYKQLKSEENINKIKIFGEEFVKNNKNHCKIIHQGNELYIFLLQMFKIFT